MGDDSLRRLKEAEALLDAVLNRKFEEDLLRSMMAPVEDDGTPCCELHGMLHHHWGAAAVVCEKCGYLRDTPNHELGCDGD